MAVSVPFKLISNQDVTMVELAGSFNNWTRVPMIRDGGEWSISLDLSPGCHQYKFVIDQEWRHDPGQPTTDNDMGTLNNIVMVEEGSDPGRTPGDNDIETLSNMVKGVEEQCALETPVITVSAAAEVSEYKAKKYTKKVPDMNKRNPVPAYGRDKVMKKTLEKIDSTTKPRLVHPIRKPSTASSDASSRSFPGTSQSKYNRTIVKGSLVTTGQKLGTRQGQTSENPLLMSPITRGRLAQVTGGNKQLLTGAKQAATGINAGSIKTKQGVDGTKFGTTRTKQESRGNKEATNGSKRTEGSKQMGGKRPETESSVGTIPRSRQSLSSQFRAGKSAQSNSHMNNSTTGRLHQTETLMAKNSKTKICYFPESF